MEADSALICFTGRLRIRSAHKLVFQVEAAKERCPETARVQVNEGFWDERARRCKHTGWADAAIYAYDQIARLRAIERIIASAGLNHGSALDFGTGSGDFAVLLGRTFAKVVACDISREVIEVAKRRYGHRENITFLHSQGAGGLELADDSLDLVLSITVLGHIMDDDELRETVRAFRRLLCPSGLFIALEYTPVSDMPDTAYQRFLNFDGWLQRLADCGFALSRYYGFYHPSERPCPSYTAYRSRSLVRVLSRGQHYLRNRTWVSRLCARSAASILAQADDYFWEGREDDVIRIMLFERNNSR